MSSRNALRTSLFGQLHEVFRQAGFAALRRTNSFVRRRDESKDQFQLVFLRKGWVQPNVAVRFDLVEQIFHTTSDFPQIHMNETPTIGTSVGSVLFNSASQCEFPLASEYDVAPTSEALVNVFQE